MQFVVIGRDGTDTEAPARRQQVRDEHLAGMKRLKASGNFILGGAMLNDDGIMIGSTIIVDFPDRAALDGWLKNDPYVIHKVWHEIEVRPYRIANV